MTIPIKADPSVCFHTCHSEQLVAKNRIRTQKGSEIFCGERKMFMLLSPEKVTKDAGCCDSPAPRNAAQVWFAPSVTNRGILPSFISFTRQRILSRFSQVSFHLLKPWKSTCFPQTSLFLFRALPRTPYTLILLQQPPNSRASPCYFRKEEPNDKKLGNYTQRSAGSGF